MSNYLSLKLNKHQENIRINPLSNNSSTISSVNGISRTQFDL